MDFNLYSRMDFFGGGGEEEYIITRLSAESKTYYCSVLAESLLVRSVTGLKIHREEST